MAKPGRRTAVEAGIAGCADAGAPHKMQLRRRSALGDISSAVGNNAGAPGGAGGASNAGPRKSVSVSVRRPSTSGVC